MHERIIESISLFLYIYISSEIKTKFSSLQLDNTERQGSFLIPLFLIHAMRRKRNLGKPCIRYVCGFYWNPCQEPSYTLFLVVGPSASKEEEREEEGKEITEENREKKRTDERKGGGSDEARVNRVQSRERKEKGGGAKSRGALVSRTYYAVLMTMSEAVFELEIRRCLLNPHPRLRASTSIRFYKHPPLPSFALHSSSSSSSSEEENRLNADIFLHKCEMFVESFRRRKSRLLFRVAFSRVGTGLE